MDNQHKHIKGYRDLTPEDIALMNEVKALGPHIKAVLDKVQANYLAQYTALADLKSDERAAETARLNDIAQPGRWLAMARTDFQMAVMKLVRAVAQPNDSL